MVVVGKSCAVVVGQLLHDSGGSVLPLLLLQCRRGKYRARSSDGRL